jgi:SAM-dependent methyltransferase
MLKVHKILAVFLIFPLIFVGFFLLKRGKWDKYYKNKIDQLPHEIVTNALKLFSLSGQAIDLGCGVGNEALLLVNEGWKVWAVDSEPKAIQLVESRTNGDISGKLVATIAKFEEGSTWARLPIVDFIYAANSLPFCKPREFEKVWSCIKQHIAPGGRFAGHFFGGNYQGFTAQEMKGMAFFKREEVLAFFQEFEIEHFQEIEEEGQSGTGRPIHSHIFEVIARKN